MAGWDTWRGREERMPPMAAVWDMRAGRHVAAAAIAVALQGIFYWIVLHETIQPTAAPKSTPLEVSIFAAASTPRPAPMARKRGHPALRPLSPIQKERSPVAAPRERPITVLRLPKPAPRAPIDWRQAMQDEVRAEQSRSRPGKLDFGFPQEAAAVAPAAAFGWDYARTHRVEELPGGGTIINLTDHCAIVFYVLPIPVCKIGRIPANGHLFDQMHESNSTSEQPGGLP